MEKRKYGTGDSLSVVGFAGIIVMNETAEDCKEYVSEAVDRGVNYFDVAPQYGNAQDMLGPALEPYRNNAFLACKTLERQADGAERELNDSLGLLKTDRFDLYQFHSVTTKDDVDQILGPNGALETFVKAKDAGKIRHIGFSAHSEEAAVRLLDAYDFDSVLFPLNWVNWFQGNFGPRVVEAAAAKSASILALKSLARTSWDENEEREWSKTWYRPATSYGEAALALRFTLSLPITAAVSPGHMELFRWACDAAEKLTPLTDDERDALKTRSEALEPIFSIHKSRWE